MTPGRGAGEGIWHAHYGLLFSSHSFYCNIVNVGPNGQSVKKSFRNIVTK